jgi:hypothetical protein
MRSVLSKKSEVLTCHNVSWDELVKLSVYNFYCMLTVLEWHWCMEADPSEQIPCGVFATWTIHHLQLPAVLKVCTSGSLVRMFGNTVDTVINSFSVAWGKQWDFVQGGGLMLLVTQFQSKRYSWLLRRVWGLTRRSPKFRNEGRHVTVHLQS